MNLPSPPKKRRLRAFLFTCVLLSPLFLFSTKMQSWGKGGRVAQLGQELIYPLEFTWHKIVSSLSYVWRVYFDLSESQKENLRLKRQLALLEVQVLDYEHQVAEGIRLRKLLGFAQGYEKELQLAEVVANPSQGAFESLRITKGTKHGIQVGMPVIAAQGVVGRILRVGSYYADIQLHIDSNFSLDVLVQRTRKRGVLQGMAQNSCRLKLQRQENINIGDTVITSGLVGAFPKGLPLGQVVKISYVSGDVSQIIVVRPWVDHRNLEEVVVLMHVDKKMDGVRTLLDKSPLLGVFKL